MANWTPEDALPKLRRRLGLSEGEGSTELMLDVLEDAANAVLLYLNREELPTMMGGSVVQLAALDYQRATQENGGVKSWSYSEGEQSQNATLLTDEEYESGRALILKNLAPYRLVKAKEAATDETA